MPEAPDGLLAQARSHLDSGDVAQALGCIEKLLTLYPDHPRGHLDKGFVRFCTGEVEEALAAWERAFQLDPQLIRQFENPDLRLSLENALNGLQQRVTDHPHQSGPLVQLGRAYFLTGRLPQALQSFTSALRLVPEDIEAGLGCAQVHFRQGQGEQATQILHKLYESHPNDAELCRRLARLYLSLNSAAPAARFLERAIQITPNSWSSHLELAQLLLRQGRHELATARFQKTLELNSRCATALLGLAECSKELYRFEEATGFYERALELDPKDSRALTQLGSLQIQLGGLDPGIETLLQALKLAGGEVEIFAALGRAFQQKGDWAQAAVYFAKAVELNPQDGAAAYQLGLIYRSQGELAQAAQAFGLAAAARPQDSHYQYHSARALLELHRGDLALEAAARAVQLSPHSKESQLLLGRCYLESSRFPEALEAFRLAVQIDGQYVEGHYQLAVAMMKLGQLEQARQSLHTLLRLSPNYAPAQLGLGQLARRLGQWQTAADHLRQAIQLDLGSLAAMSELAQLYLERRQGPAILEFIRQVCLTRRGEPRLPEPFLAGWLKVLSENGQWELAQETVELLVSLFPQHPLAGPSRRDILLGRIRALQQAGQVEQAEELLRKLSPNVSEPQPPSAPSPTPSLPLNYQSLLALPHPAVDLCALRPQWMALVLQLQADGDYKTASLLAWESARLGQTSPELLELQGQLLLQWAQTLERGGQADPAQQLRTWQAQLALSSSSQRCAVPETRVEPQEEAILPELALTERLRVKPWDGEVRQGLFDLLEDDVPRLLRIFRELVAQEPEQPYHVLNLGRAYAKTGSESLAVLQYRKYVKLDATAEGYQELAEVYQRLGKLELAQEAQRRAHKLARP